MKNLSKVSTPKKVFLVGLGVLSTGTVVLIIGLQQSPALWQTFQCGYDLSLNNSSLTRDQINEYCNNQVRDAENLEDGLTTAGFGIILIVIGLIIIVIGGGIWIMVIRRRERIEASSEISMEMMSNKEEQEGDRFTPKKVLIYCLIVGLVSGILSFLIDGLRLLSMAAFVFTSITGWYMFGEKFHKWKQRKR